jgi:hypothetical protein
MLTDAALGKHAREARCVEALIGFDERPITSRFRQAIS